MAQRLKTDWILFAAVLGILAFGLIILYSASSVMAEMNYRSSYRFLLRQALWAAASVALMMLLKRTDYRRFQTPTVAFSAVGIAFLMLIVVYLQDAKFHRWLNIAGVGLQPAEFAKPALVLFLAYFVAHRAAAINNRQTLAPALLTVGLITVGVMIADLGTAVVLAATAAVVFFVAGLEWRYILFAAGLAVLGIGIAVVARPYRLARIIGYVDPSHQLLDRIDTKGWVKSHLQSSLATRDTNYQGQQSIIAVGAGGVTGLGMMHGRQKLFYIPEAHTDFIYAVVGEELGMFGSLLVLTGFLLILWRGLRATMRVPDDFGRYLALGITSAIVIQALMNMSVVLHLMPTKGIPLPMISYGGNSLLSTLASLGILLNVSEHAG